MNIIYLRYLMMETGLFSKSQAVYRLLDESRGGAAAGVFCSGLTQSELWPWRTVLAHGSACDAALQTKH